jgi:hypothetical protein
MSLEDFVIYASYRESSAGFWGTLKVVRTTDKRVLFPFDGCPEFGPFFDAGRAVAAAQAFGEKLVAADILHPNCESINASDGSDSDAAAITTLRRTSCKKPVRSLLQLR